MALYASAPVHVGTFRDELARELEGVEAWGRDVALAAVNISAEDVREMFPEERIAHTIAREVEAYRATQPADGGDTPAPAPAPAPSPARRSQRAASRGRARAEDHADAPEHSDGAEPVWPQRRRRRRRKGAREATLRALQALVERAERAMMPVVAEVGALDGDAPLLCLTKEGKAALRKALARQEVNYLDTSTTSNPLPAGPAQPVPPNEVVLRVAVHHAETNSKLQEFLVLGSTPLCALRDVCYCQADRRGDIPTTQSALFYFENELFSDMRGPQAVDYGEHIRSWALAHKRRFPTPLRVARMSTTTFADVTVRVSYPYLYAHQGNCQHLLYVHEIRRVSARDPRDVRAYPHQVFQAKGRRRKCSICGIYFAKWITQGDRLATENPCFFCAHCYTPLHYTPEGRLLYSDFRVFPYQHD